MTKNYQQNVENFRRGDNGVGVTKLISKFDDTGRRKKKVFNPFFKIILTFIW